MAYTTLQNVRLQLQEISSSNNTVDDAAVASYLEIATAMIDDYCGQHFREEIRTLDQSPRISGIDLAFRHIAPLISVTQLVNGDGQIIPSNGYRLYPSTEYPKQTLTLNAGYFWTADPNQAAYAVYNDPDGIYLATYAASSQALIYSRSYTAGSFAVNGIKLSGLWGFNRKGPNAWLLTNVTVGTTTTAGQLTLTISAPGTLIDVGSILRIDSEYFTVTGPIVNTAAATTLTVIPGENGSTPAAHNSGTAIYIYLVEPVIVQATAKLAAALYQGRNNATGQAMTMDNVTVSAPASIPPLVKQMLPTPYHNVFNGTAKDGK